MLLDSFDFKVALVMDGTHYQGLTGNNTVNVAELVTISFEQV